jgi:hypothetical protein
VSIAAGQGGTATFTVTNTGLVPGNIAYTVARRTMAPTHSATSPVSRVPRRGISSMTVGSRAARIPRERSSIRSPAASFAPTTPRQ